MSLCESSVDAMNSRLRTSSETMRVRRFCGTCPKALGYGLNLIQAEANSRASEQSSLLWPGKDVSASEKEIKIKKAAFYAVQIFYSFFIMYAIRTFSGQPKLIPL